MNYRRVTSVFLLYLALTIAMTWPLVTAPAVFVPADLGDPMLNAWLLWWNAYTVPLTASLRTIGPIRELRSSRPTRTASDGRWLAAESPTQRWFVAEASMLESARTGPEMVPGTICGS